MSLCQSGLSLAWKSGVGPWCTLPFQISLWLVYSVIIHNHKWLRKSDQFWNYWSLLYPLIFNYQRKISHVGIEPRSALLCQVSRGSVHYVASGGENPQILPHFQLQHILDAQHHIWNSSPVNLHNINNTLRFKIPEIALFSPAFLSNRTILLCC